MKPTEQQERWVVRLSSVEAENQLATLYGQIDAQVCAPDQRDGGLWLRGTGELPIALLAIPQAAVFQLLPDGQLIPWGRRVPTAQVPGGPWQALTEWISVRPPLANLSGEPLAHVELRVCRSSQSIEHSLLRCPHEQLRQYVLRTPELRSQHWEFVTTSAGDSLCRGWPLPPLAGQFWYQVGRIALPVGWTWQPTVSPEVVFDLLCHANRQAKRDGLFLLHPDGPTEVIEDEDWCRVSYAAVRASGAME